MRQHEVVRAGGSTANFGLDRIDADLADVIGPRRIAGLEEVRGELVFTLVDPVDARIQRRERACDRAADVAGAVKLQMKARRRLGPRRDRFGIELFEAQGHRAAAALPERRAERVVARAGCAIVRMQHAAGLVDRLQFEVAAADRAGGLVESHEHPRAGLARRRSARVGDPHDDGIAARAEPRDGECAIPFHRSSARRCALSPPAPR